MDNRPFYELDDDEILIEEAAQAALSDAVRPVATAATTVPALPLRSALDRAQTAALSQRFALKQTLTLLDHAYLMNKLACTLSVELEDVFGLAAAMRAETALLMLDMSRTAATSRSNKVPFPADGLALLRAAALDYSKPVPPGLSLRLERDALSHFANDVEGNGTFFAYRRLTVALMPTLTPVPLLTDTLERYKVSARILLSSAAAKQAMMPWIDVARLGDQLAERDARSVIDVLRENIGVFEL